MINFVLIHLRCTSSAFNLRYLHVILSRSCVSEAESYSCSVGSRCTHWYVNYGNKNHKHLNCNPSFVIHETLYLFIYTFGTHRKWLILLCCPVFCPQIVGTLAFASEGPVITNVSLAHLPPPAAVSDQVPPSSYSALLLGPTMVKSSKSILYIL